MEKSYAEQANTSLIRLNYDPAIVPAEDTEEYQEARAQAVELLKYPDLARLVVKGEIDVSEAQRRIAKRKKEAAILHALFTYEAECVDRCSKGDKSMIVNPTLKRQIERT